MQSLVRVHTASIRSSGEAMVQSSSGGSGKPSRMTLTVMRSLREFSDMKEIIARTDFSTPKRKSLCYIAAKPPKRSGPTCAINTKPALDPQPSKERMKIMTRHSSATAREEKSHTIDASLKQRARLLTTNGSIPTETRSLIRYALEIKDPCLDQLVRRVESGEMTIDHVHLE